MRAGAEGKEKTKAKSLGFFFCRDGWTSVEPFYQGFARNSAGIG